MGKVIFPLLVGFILSVITVVGDLFIKEASLHNGFSGWRWLILGAVIYGLTAFGWFFVIRHINLSLAGVVYSITCVVLLFALGVVVFKEGVNTIEIVGLVMALTSLVMLLRFA